MQRLSAGWFKLPPFSNFWEKLIHRVEEQQSFHDKVYPAVVHSDGRVEWNTPRIFRSSCLLDVAEYPRDSQSCQLVFGSRVYDNSQLQLHNKTPDAEVVEGFSDGVWKIVKSPASQVNNSKVSLTVFTFHLERMPLYNLIQMIFPSILLGSVGFLVFLLPTESGEKISLSVTVLLSIIVYIFVLTAATPTQSNSVPRAGKSASVIWRDIKNEISPSWTFLQFRFSRRSFIFSAIYTTAGRLFMVLLVLLSISTLLTVLTLNIHYRGTGGNRMPKSVEVLVLRWLATLVGMRTQAEEVLQQLVVSSLFV